MPQLLLFVPCQNALVNAEDQILSLLSIMERLNVEYDANEVFPAIARLPITWNVVALWRAYPGEIGETYNQRFRIIHPDGTFGLMAETTLPLTDISYRTVAKIEGFVVTVPGDYRIILELEDKEQAGQWHQVGEYPLIVALTPKTMLGPVAAAVAPTTQRQTSYKKQKRRK